MRIKLTLLLLLLNGALLSVILYLDRAQSTRDLLAESSRIILNAEFLQGLSTVNLSGASGELPWKLEKEDTEWFIRSPHDWKANPFAVDRLLFALNNLRWESRFAVADLNAAGQSLASYGLDDPPFEIEMTSLGQTLRLAFGSQTEIGNRLYVLSPDGREIYVINQDSLPFLSAEPETFLNPEIFSIHPEEILAMQIQDRLANNTRVRLEKRGTAWEFVSPVQTGANPDAVLAFLDTWSFLQTEEFLKVEEAFPATAQESLRFTIETTGKREVLLIRAPENATDPYLAKREGFNTAFPLRRDLIDSLRSVQGDLREKQLLRPYANDWTSLEIQFRELNVSLQQLENGSWQVLHTDADGQLISQPADRVAIEKLRQQMRTFEARGFITDAPSAADLERFDLVEPQRTVLIRRENQETIALSIGGLSPDPERTLLYATLDNSDSVFLVRPDLLAAFSLDPFTYREKTIFALPEGAVLESAILERVADGSEVNQPDGSALEQTIDSLARMTRVDTLISRPLKDPLELADGRTIRWPLRLRILYRVNPESETPLEKVLLISNRIGGTTLFIADPTSLIVGTIPSAYIEPLDAVLTRFPNPPAQSPDTAETPPMPPEDP